MSWRIAPSSRSFSSSSGRFIARPMREQSARTRSQWSPVVMSRPSSSAAKPDDRRVRRGLDLLDRGGDLAPELELGVATELQVLPPLQGAPDRQAEVRHLPGLLHEVERADLDRLDRVVEVGAAGHHDVGRDRLQRAADAVEEVDPAHLRHPEVGQEEVELLVPQELHRVFPGRRDDARVPVELELRREGLADGRLVVDDQDPVHPFTSVACRAGRGDPRPLLSHRPRAGPVLKGSRERGGAGRGILRST